MSRPSRTGQDQKRAAEAASNVPIAWGSVRGLYPAAIRQRVDQLVERGGFTMRDLSAVTSAQLMADLMDQGAGGDAGTRIASHLRLLFRIALASGGVGDASSAMVQVPPELRAVHIDDSDFGDDLI
jgi:hypothetical protein